MEDILVKIPSAYKILFDEYCDIGSEYVSVSDLLSIIDEQNNEIETLKEQINELETPIESDYRYEVIAEQRREEELLRREASR